MRPPDPFFLELRLNCVLGSAFERDGDRDTHARARALASRARARTHTHIHAHTHTRTHTHTHTRARARARAHTQSLTYTQSTTRKNVQICSFFICTETSITAVVKLFPGAVYANDTVGRLREVRHPVRLPFPVVLPNFPPVIHGPG